MKKIMGLLMVCLLTSCGADKTSGPSQGGIVAADRLAEAPRITALDILAHASSTDYAEGELIVAYRRGARPEAPARISQAVGSRKLRGLQLLNAEHVALPSGMSVRDAVVRYMQDPDVEYAEPNYVRSIRSTVPDDPLFPSQWALRNTAVAGADLMMIRAWDITRGTGGVVVAVLDTGIDYFHPDLAGNIWTNPGEPNCASVNDNDNNGFTADCRGWNFIARNNHPMDDNGHGSHVSGTIGAMGNNGTGIAGMMWNVKIMPLKVLNSSGDGTIADEVAAIQYAVKHGARVINASFAGDSYSLTEANALWAANAAGVLLTTAAGNGHNGPGGTNNDIKPVYPGNHGLPNIITVAATDSHDRLATFSNYGPATVHVAAPGTAILGAVPAGLERSFCGMSPYPGYAYCDGTSMATPYVSGLAGLLFDYYPDFSPSQVRATVLAYSDQLSTLKGKIIYGRINAYRSLSSLQQPSALTAAVSSADVTLSWSDNARGEEGYRIERKSPGADFIEIASIDADSTTYTDHGLTSGVVYTYRVKAFNSIPAESAYSEEMSITTPGQPEPAPSGGGGCSVALQGTQGNSYGDMSVLLLPALVIFLLRAAGRGRP